MKNRLYFIQILFKMENYELGESGPEILESKKFTLLFFQKFNY